MAAQHAFDLGEPDTVARLVEQARDQTLTEADWARLELAQLVEQYDNFPPRRVRRQRHRHRGAAFNHHDPDDRPSTLRRGSPEHVKAFELLP